MLKNITFVIVISVISLTACKIIPNILPYTGCREKSAFEQHVSDMENGGILVMEVNYFSNYSSPFRVSYKYRVKDKDFFIRTLVTSGHDDNYFIPKGGKYLMSYDTVKPKRTGGQKQVIALHQPVYDSTQVFEKTTAEVKSAFFLERRGMFFYGGLQLIFSYKVGDKEYISHNGINLCKKFPYIENPEDSLNFVWRKFEVEYDIENPYISRILLDKEVEPRITHASNVEKILTHGKSWKKGTTLMGYSYAKCARKNPNLWGELNEDKSKWHKEAEKHFFELMDSPKALSWKRKPDDTKYLERKLSDGRGIRLYTDKTFMEFFD